MSFWVFARGPASVRLLLEFGLERGLTEAALLARSKIAPAQLNDPNIELTALQELRVVENLLRLTSSPPGLGLEVGLRYRFSTFGLWGYGLVCSATLAEALERALRFIQLTYAYSAIEHAVDGDTCSLRLRPPSLTPGLSRFLVERDLAVAASLLADLGGPSFRLLSFELQQGRGRAFRPSSTVTSVAGAKPRLDAQGYSLSFASTWLACRLVNANPTSAAMCDEMCAKLVERRRLREGTATLVRQVLAATATDSRPGLGRLAELTSTSERTLRRRLQSEGVSYRSILAATQALDAVELVCDKSLSITAIAERLGYADLSTFSQAFKRWHGVSPAAYRRGLT
jgi:AraC-like DNA-binding protein